MCIKPLKGIKVWGQGLTPKGNNLPLKVLGRLTHVLCETYLTVLYFKFYHCWTIMWKPGWAWAINVTHKATVSKPKLYDKYVCYIFISSTSKTCVLKGEVPSYVQVRSKATR